MSTSVGSTRTSIHYTDPETAAPQALVVPGVGAVQPMNAGQFVSPGWGRHPRRRIDSYELIVVLSGCLRLAEERSHFTLRAGDALILWPGRMHGPVEDYPRDLSFYWLHFGVEPARLRTRRNDEWLEVPQHAHLLRPERMADLFRRFIDDQETGCLRWLDAALMLMLMLGELCKAQELHEVSHQERLADTVENYISSNVSRRLSTARIAAELRYNPDYLGRVFRASTGHSITDAIHRRKIKEARALLTRNELTVVEIADACGFHDVCYFRRVFKGLVGMTPTQFRQLYSHAHINTH